MINMLRQGYHIISYRPLCLWEKQVAAEAAFRGITIKSLLVSTDILHTIKQVTAERIYPSLSETVKGIQGTPWVYQYHKNEVTDVYDVKYTYINVGNTKPFIMYLPTNLRPGDTLLLDAQELK